MCCFSAGGFSWDLCIVPAIILSACAFYTTYKFGSNKLICIISLAFIILSSISIVFTLGDTQSAIYEAQKIILFITAFYIAGVCDLKSFLIKTFSVLSALISAIGLLSYLNFLNFSEFVFWDMYIPRLQSVIKYANTTALFLAVGYISSINGYRLFNKKYYLLLSAIVLTGLYLTLSKAMIPIFIAIGTLYIFFEKDLRGIFISQNVITALFTTPIVYFASKHIYFLCFSLIAVLILISFNCPLKGKKQIFKIWLVLFAVAVIAGITVLIIRFESLTTLTGRLVYAKDSLGLIFINPIFGCGQGSWQYLQYGVQTMGYSVKYIHNSYLQFLVENGFIFTALFIFVPVYTLFKTFKAKNYAYTAMLLLICLHSFIDFDLSFGIILIITGLICGEGFYNKTCNKAFKVITYSVLALLSVVLIYASSELIVRDNFEKAYISKNYETAEKYNNLLLKLCPADPQVYINKASLDQINTGSITDTAKKNLLKAKTLSPNDHQILREYIKAIADSDNIIKLTNEFLTLSPMQENSYLFIKETVQKLYESHKISDELLDRVLKISEKLQKKYDVKDRNKLLRDTAKKG